MKLVPALILFGGLVQIAFSRPVKDGDNNDSSIYIAGSIRNAALSHQKSKSQAVSDRQSEWNNTHMNSHRMIPIKEGEQKNERAGLLIYAGGDAANLALAYSGSEAQAAENDQKSGYNNHSMGLASGIADSNDYEDEHVEQ